MHPSIPHSFAGCSPNTLLINWLLLLLLLGEHRALGALRMPATCLPLLCLSLLRAPSPCPTHGLESPWELAPSSDPHLTHLCLG